MEEPERKVGAILALAVVCLAAIPYLGILHAPFVFDDIKLVKENEFLRSAWEDPRKVLEIFDVTARRWDEQELRPNYRPLRFLSYLADYKLSRWWYGDFPQGDPPVFFFHLTNVLLHAANSFLVFWVVRRLARDLSSARAPPAGAPGGTPPGDSVERLALFAGFWAGLLFAVHPLQTEAVTYISGRRDVLSTFFFLAALAVHLRAAPAAVPGLGTVVAVPLLFAAGLLSKEMVITLPGVLLVVDLARRARWSAPRAAVHGLAWGLALLQAALVLSNPRLVQTAGGPGPEGVLLTAARYACRYLGLGLLPLSQSVDYSFDAIPESRGLLEPWTTLPSLVLVAAIAAAAAWGFLGRSRSPWKACLFLGTAWFLGTLLPVLQLVPAAERFAERFAYLPIIGVVFLASALLARAWKFEPLFAWGLCALLAVPALAAAVNRNKDWRSPLDLWTSAAQAQPRAARAHLGRANALKEAGRLREAVDEYTLAIEIFGERPEVPLHHGFLLQALTLRGGVLGLLGTEDPSLLGRAVADYRRVLASKDTDGTAIEGSPRHTVVHFDLGGFLLMRDSLVEARREYERVLEIGTPITLVGAAHYYLGKIALLEKKPAEAAGSYKKAYEVIPPGDPVRYQVVAVELADLLIEEKRWDEALAVVDRAIADGAAGPARRHLEYRRAKVLDRRGDLSGCRTVLEAILREDPAYVPALLTLGGIEANLGKFDEAARRYQAVPRSDPRYGEALQGLQQALILKKLAEGGQGAPSGVDDEQVLAALEKKGLDHLGRLELVAARDVFADLLRRSQALGDKKYQVRAARELAGVVDTFARHDDARKYLEFALELEPLDPESLRRLADLKLRRFQSPAEALDLYKRYLAALPEGVAADPKVYFNLSSLLAKTDPRLAIDYLLQARKGGLDSAAVDRSLGYLHAECSQWDESLEAFTRYLQWPPEEGSEAAREEVRTFVKERVMPHALRNEESAPDHEKS